MICYICKNEFIQLQSLVIHFKVFHSLGPDSSYDCCEKSCFQSFQSLSSFKRHVKNKHIIKLASNVSVPTQNCIINNTNIDTPSLTSNATSIFVQNDNFNGFNYQSAVSDLHKSAVQFVLGLHVKNNITFRDVLNIQKGIVELITKPTAQLLDSFVKEKINDPLLLSSFKALSLDISNTFTLCSTEYRLMNWLMEEQYINHLNQIVVNREVTSVYNKGEVIYDENVTKGLLMPMKFQFKKFFEHGNNLQLSLDRINNLNSSNSLKNFIQGDLWKTKLVNFSDKIVFPYFLFIDDLEINNPLGSHSTFQAVSAVYYSFPLLENNSKLTNIFLAAIIKSVDMKEYGNESCLKSLIDVLYSFEKEGIIISTPEKGDTRVYFMLGLVLGDNLGLNSILDFSRSFSASYFCRFCKASKDITKKLFEEDSLLMRNITNYNNDVAINDISKTGVHGESFLNKIPSFHVTQNYCVDVMHDLFEGICHYDMCHIIKYFTENVKYFSLDTLNLRKSNFNYGSIEIGNISPSINTKHLQNFHLKMSAREMMTFTHFFPLMVGDLVPENDEVWLFFMNLLQIIDILLSYSICEQKVTSLKNLIHNHNRQYVLLFHDSLKPKHHILIHYPTIIRQSGPPRHFWCFRFEAKHKELKLYAHATSSRKNITYTLGKKMQMKFAYQLFHPAPTNLIINQTHEIKNNEYLQFIQSLILPIQFKCYTQVDYKGTLFKADMFVTRVIEMLNLFKILQIIVSDENNCLILAEELKVNYYHSHFDAYVVEENLTQPGSLSIFNIDDLNGPPINIIRVINNQTMIRLKEYY